jgi:hypothetical protein
LRKIAASASGAARKSEGQFLLDRLSEAAKGLEKSAETAKSARATQQACAERWNF